MAASLPHPPAEPFDAGAYFFPEKHAGGFSRHNTTVQFYVRVNALLRPEMTVLDFGAGRGEGVVDERRPFVRSLRNLRGKVRRVVGVDVDPVVTTNPTLDEAHILPPGPGLALPLADASVDLILADWVFEHVEHPAAMAAEFHRVLKPGGWVCARTPNKWGYIGIGARLVPDALRDRVLQHLQPGRHKQDIFPVVYRINSGPSVRQYFPQSEWHNFSYNTNGDPAYAANNPLLWRAFLSASLLTPPALMPVRLTLLRRR